MKNQTKIEDIVKAARAGNKTAEDDFFSKLAVRFLSELTCELQKYPILIKSVNIEDTSQEIWQKALTEVKQLFPLSTKKWKLTRAMSVLRNILDDHITNTLTELAKEGNSEAEELLFSIIRKKLIKQVDRRRWRISPGDYQNK
jgi:hypothetical protein